MNFGLPSAASFILNERCAMPGSQPQAQALLQSRPDRLEQLTPSAIRAVHNAAERLRATAAHDDFIYLHFGEGDLGTPEFIVEAGVAAMRGGALNYENNAGRPDLIAAKASILI